MNRIIPELWAEQMMPGYKSKDPKLQQIRAETKWIRESLEAELAPDWLVEMVVENWMKERWETWTTSLF